MKDRSKEFILWFNEIGIEDIPLVGGKNASLGEMYRILTKKGVRVPNGFAITAYAYQYIIEKSGALPKLKAALRGLNVKNVRSLTEALSFENEKKMMKTIRELEKKLKEATKASGMMKDTRGLSKDIDQLKKQADELHVKIQQKAQASQEKHEKLLELSKQVDEF